jgi:hypothetical protein
MDCLCSSVAGVVYYDPVWQIEADVYLAWVKANDP